MTSAAEFIAGFEGFRSDAYPDPGTGGEPWTIGFGSTRHPGSGLPIMPGTSITRERAMEYLAHDIASAEAAVARLVKVPLTEGQRVAVTSLVYNVGEGAFARSTLLRLLNSGATDAAAREFDKWNRAGGRVLPGLVRRRAAERQLFLQGLSPAPTAVSSLSSLAPTSSPTTASAPEVHPVKDSASMDPISPFIIAAANQLIPFVPSLIRAFGGKGERTEANARTAEQVVEIAKQITGAQTAEGAVQAVAGDPAKQAELREAVHQNLGDVLDILAKAVEVDDASRDKAADRALRLAKETGGRWLYLLGGVAIAVVAASYAITAGVLFTGSTFSDETKALLLGQVVIFGFVTVLGFLFGSNIQNRITASEQRRQ